MEKFTESLPVNDGREYMYLDSHRLIENRLWYQFAHITALCVGTKVLVAQRPVMVFHRSK